MFRFTTSVVVALIIAATPLVARADDASKFLADEHFESVHTFKLRMREKTPAFSVKELTYVAPDRLSIEFRTQHFGVVMIGHKVWVRSGDTWSAQKRAPARDPLSIIHGLTALGDGVKGKTVTYLGDEDIHGTPTHMFRLEKAAEDGKPGFVERVWLGASDGYPRKVFLKNGDYAMVATYSAFNTPLVVTQPQ